VEHFEFTLNLYLNVKNTAEVGAYLKVNYKTNERGYIFLNNYE